MDRKFPEVIEEMKREYPTRDGGTSQEYIFFKNKKRVLSENEYILFELTDKVNDNLQQVQAGEQMYEKHWTHGYFIQASGERLSSEPVRLVLSNALARSVESYCEKFDETFESGKKYRFFGGQSYKGKPAANGFQSTIYPINLGVLKDKTVDTTKEGNEYKSAAKVSEANADDLEIDEDLL